MNRTNTLACITLITLAGLGGCAKHGGYTQDHLDASTKKLNILKGNVQMQTAQQQFLSGDLEKALKSVNNAMEISPKMSASHVLRGRILIELGSLDEAQLSFEQARKLEPANIDAHFFDGFVYEQTNRPLMALERYQQAMKLDPANPQYIVATAEMLIALNRSEEATAMLSSVSQSHAYNAGLRQLRGQIAMLKGKYAEAAQFFSEANMLASNDAHIMEDLARAQLRAGMYGDAEATLSALVTMPDNADRRDLKMMQAKCLISLQRLGEARSALMALTSTPEGKNDTAALFDLGQVSVKLGDQQRLRFCAGAIIQNAPDMPEGHLLKAMYHRTAGEFEVALTAVNKAVLCAPADPTPLALRALILQQLGRSDEARADMKHAMAMDEKLRGRAVNDAPKSATVPTE